MDRDMEILIYLIFFMVVAAIMLINFNEDMDNNNTNMED